MRYRLVFHSNPCFVKFNDKYHREYLIGDESNVSSIELSIDRMIKRDLGREPCEEDPAYDINVCHLQLFSQADVLRPIWNSNKREACLLG